MPAFEKPKFDFNYKIETEIARLRDYRDSEPGRRIPKKHASRLLLASWNVANLGVQERREKDHALIAEIISWFDLVALQEVNEDLRGLRGVMEKLPAGYRVIFSDAAGNNERMAFVYNSARVALLEKVGEIAIPPADLKNVKLPGIEQKFDGFDRTPYLASFRCGGFSFCLVNVHLYYGSFASKSESAISMNRRTLETFAVARWAKRRRDSDTAYLKDIIVLGDFNLPKKEPGDPIFTALTKTGLRLPSHTSQVGSNLAGDQYYDQIGFFPDQTDADFTGEVNVFDFDGALFRGLWDTRSEKDFRAYMRYYISDHRLIWAEFKV